MLSYSVDSAIQYLNNRGQKSNYYHDLHNVNSLTCPLPFFPLVLRRLSLVRFCLVWRGNCSLSFQSFALRQLVTRPQHHETTVTIMVTGLTSTKSDTIFSSILNKGFFLSNLTRI